MKKQTIFQVMSHLGKQSQKKHPHPREHFVKMGKKSGKVRQKLIHKISTKGKLTTDGELE